MSEEKIINSGLNLYDANKQLMAKEKLPDPIEKNKIIEQMCKDIFAKASAKKDYLSSYWMLLCHERRDYTVFAFRDDPSDELFVKELKITLNNRGSFVSAEKQPDGAWEIWVRDETNENFVYYIFPYTEGVIEV